MGARETSVACGLTALLGCASGQLPSPAHAEAGARVLSQDGAWCWYQDPRALYSEAGRRPTTYAAWMTHDGQLQVGAYEHGRRRARVHTLEPQWGADDHNAASLLELPDGRLMVFYAQHNGDGLYTRTSVDPGDVSAWSPRVTVTGMPNVTYSHPAYLSAEGRFYVFWRGETWKPTFSSSADGVRWSAPKILLQDEGRSGQFIRPYLKVTSDNHSSIHLAFTDGHPRDEEHNSIYYLRYEAGAFVRADGTEAGQVTSLPIAVSAGDPVYDASTTGVRAWIWDVASDDRGHPYVAYTRLPAEDDHRYHVARWSGTEWLDAEVAPAGAWFPQTPAGEVEREPHYSGGITLHPADPRIAYLSRGRDGQFSLERWALHEPSGAWRGTVLVEAAGLNVRPVIPRGWPAGEEHVLWMTGDYGFFLEDFETQLLMLAPNARARRSRR